MANERASGFTKTGAEATRISGPDLSGASFSRAGVVDRSAQFKSQAKAIQSSTIAGAIAEGGRIGLEADEGFAKAQLEGNIQDFIAQTKPEEVVKAKQSLFSDVSTDLLNLQESQRRTAEADDVSATLEQSAPEFKAIMGKLEAGASQGILTRDELELRAKEATRKAIARRPGLARELTQHAEQVLNLSGVRDIQEFEDNIAELEAKRFEEGRKKIINESVKQGLVVDLLNPDIDGLNLQLQQRAMERNAFEDAKQLEALSEAEREAAKETALQQAPLAVQGMYQEFTENALDLIRPGMSQQELAGAIFQIESSGRNYKGVTDTFLEQAGIRGAEATPHRTRANTQIDAFVTSLKEFAGGGNIAEFAVNARTAIENNQKTALREKFDVETAELMHRFINTIPGMVLARSPEVQDKLATFGGQLMQGELTSGNFKDAVVTTDFQAGVPDLVSVLGGVMKASVPNDTDIPETRALKNPAVFEKALGQASELLIDNPHGVSSEQRFDVLKNLVVQMTGPEINSFLNNATPGTKKQLGDLYDQYRIVLNNQRDKQIAKAEDAGVSVATKFTPDGRMVFDVEHTNTTVQREWSNRLNNGVGNRSNELLQAFGTLFGEDVARTSEILRGDFEGTNVPSEEDPIVSLIKDEEGFREEAYLDSAGVPTIGFGFTQIDGKPVEIGDVITREEAEGEVTKQIQEHSAFKNEVEVALTPSQQQALSSFEFNLGSGIWQTTGKAIITAINAGNLKEAAEIMKRHNKARDPNTKQLKEVRGLTNRREREAQLLLSKN